MSNENIFEKIALDKLKKFLQESAKVNCDGYRPEYLKRRLDIRLKATNSKSYIDYFRFLKSNPKEIEPLMNQLTINYTMFFRDTAVYQFLRNNIFPDLLSSKTLRIWSAGCASGEEPYSLAILLSDMLKDKLKNFQITIYASDIDKDALTQAANGKYSKTQLQNLSESMLSNYFSCEGDTYTVKDSIKKLVHFSQLDLMKPSPHLNLDLILCRNVMIYFSRESQQTIHMSFYKALREGGYLVTGASEILTGEPSKSFICIDVKSKVYKKPKQSTLHETEQNISFHIAEAKQNVI